LDPPVVAADPAVSTFKAATNKGNFIMALPGVTLQAANYKIVQDAC